MTDIQPIPILRSPDLAATARFYSEQLGFETFATGDTHLIVRRGAIELHFIPPDPGHEALENPSTCYIRGAGIDALYDDFVTRDVAGLIPFRHQPWGMYEFYISDPHGCLLRFGRSDTEGPAPAALC